MEIEPLTDVFEPIMLTTDQRKKVLDLLASFMKHEGENFIVVTDEDFQTKIPNVRDVYNPEEIIEDDNEK